VYSVLIDDLEVCNMERVPVRRYKKNLKFLKEYTLLCGGELEVMVTSIGTTYSM
jgi:hypothetical protein